MSSEIGTRWEFFWVYVRDEGRCSVCGEEVSPDDAATAGEVASAVVGTGKLAGHRLVHRGCKTRASQ